MDHLKKIYPPVPLKNAGIFRQRAKSKMAAGTITKNLLVNQTQKITYEDTFSGKSSTMIPILTLVWRYDIIFTHKSPSGRPKT